VGVNRTSDRQTFAYMKMAVETRREIVDPM
jgi:hypothetical protein